MKTQCQPCPFKTLRHNSAKFGLLVVQAQFLYFKSHGQSPDFKWISGYQSGIPCTDAILFNSVLLYTLLFTGVWETCILFAVYGIIR